MRKGGGYGTTGCRVCVCVFVCRTLGCVWLREWVWGGKRDFKYGPRKVRMYSLCVRVFALGPKAKKDMGEPEKKVLMCVSNKFICTGRRGRGRKSDVYSKKGGHACTDPIRQTSMHTNWSSFIGLWLYALVISHTQIMSRDWTENR